MSAGLVMRNLGDRLAPAAWAGTDRLTATTAHTGIEIEALLPGQIVESGDAQLWLIFLNFGIEIGNHRQTLRDGCV
jgi:hypothetical protein